MTLMYNQLWFCISTTKWKECLSFLSVSQTKMLLDVLADVFLLSNHVEERSYCQGAGQNRTVSISPWGILSHASAKGAVVWCVFHLVYLPFISMNSGIYLCQYWSTKHVFRNYFISQPKNLLECFIRFLTPTNLIELFITFLSPPKGNVQPTMN